MILTEGNPIADTLVPASKLNADTLCSMLSKTMSWRGKRGGTKWEPSTEDQSSTTATNQETERSLHEDLENVSVYQKMADSYNSFSSLNSFSGLYDSADSPNDDKEQKSLQRDQRYEKKHDDLDGEEKPRRAMKKEGSHRMKQRRNSITVMTSTSETHTQNHSSRQNLDGSSQHSSSNVTRSDRRRTTRPRRHSLGYTVPALTSSAEPSDFTDVLQRRLDRIEKQRIQGKSNPYGYEGDEWRESSCSDLQGKRRGRRARRHSIGSISMAEEVDPSVAGVQGTKCVNTDYGYEDPDASEPICADCTPAKRTQHTSQRRARRSSMGGQSPRRVNDDPDPVTAVQNEPVRIRQRRCSIHF